MPTLQELQKEKTRLESLIARLANTSPIALGRKPGGQARLREAIQEQQDELNVINEQITINQELQQSSNPNTQTQNNNSNLGKIVLIGLGALLLL